MEDIFAFVKAAEDGDLPRVRALLPEVAEDKHKVRALLAPIQFERYDVYSFLIASGVPVEHDACKDDVFGYPLHYAAYRDDPSAVALLLEAGATPNVLNRHRGTPMYCCKSAIVTQLLLDAGADVNAGEHDPLIVMARNGYEDALRTLLAHPVVDVNVKDGYYGDTALHVAAFGGHSGCVGALLPAGADPCALDKTGETPLAYISSVRLEGANHAGRIRSIVLLVAAGDRQWEHVPTPCPVLEKALVPVWKAVAKESTTEELRQLFRRLQPAVQATVQETLRALHHGARPFEGLPEPLRMEILALILE